MFAQKPSDSRPPSVHVTWESRRLLLASKFPQIAACDTKQTININISFTDRQLLLACVNLRSNVSEEYTHLLVSLAHPVKFVPRLETSFLQLLPENRSRHSAKSLKPLCSLDFNLQTNKQTKSKVSVSVGVLRLSKCCCLT